MAKHINLIKRITHRYRLGWADEDEWVDLDVKAKVLKSKPLEVREEGHSYHQKVVIPYATKWSDRDIERAIEDTMTRSYCHHSHDCCGCATHTATAKKVRNREWSVVVDVGYNF